MRNTCVLLLAVLALLAVALAVSAHRDDERWGRRGEEERWPEGRGRREEEERGEEEEERRSERRGRRREEERGGDEGGTGRREGDEWFLLQDAKSVVRTYAGSMKVVKGFGRSPMHIGFITMEPKSLFVPQYLDSSLILFVRRGEARVGNIYKDELVERRLKVGDIYRIGAGSAFYLVNEAEGQRLHIVCSIDTSDSSLPHTFQSFYIGGGTYPKSVLSGFDRLTLSTALNVTEEEVNDMLTSQDEGPIVYLSNTTHSPRSSMRRISQMRGEESTWSFRKMMNSFLDWSDKKKGDKKWGGRTGKGPDAYNLYDRKPDFKNDYGWSIALDHKAYPPLRHNDIGVYLVNLTAGAMMAPHINPMAIEYGIVLRGSGTIQIVYPNGSLAMNAKVNEGDVFWIPRFFPFCQIASRTGPFEFFGFTTSARNNWPQFLVGANSLLHALRGPEFAASFGMSEAGLDGIIDAQRESAILPTATVAPPDERAPVGGGVREMVT
ncbi:vicilin-like seed storage protein At2g28490 [Salvia miltiorrhiza]|uniref:vicilin-like seed storage protein At2g28490 n=1 Tax=Salvia miltiorrhiza TaxID=226208 RepID=UPI0025ACAE97|nr:vicilin-like seed storage protein At2g28490 [Salvia miltiorrhiza]